MSLLAIGYSGSWHCFSNERAGAERAVHQSVAPIKAATRVTPFFLSTENKVSPNNVTVAKGMLLLLL